MVWRVLWEIIKFLLLLVFGGAVLAAFHHFHWTPDDDLAKLMYGDIPPTQQGTVYLVGVAVIAAILFAIQWWMPPLIRRLRHKGLKIKIDPLIEDVTPKRYAGPAYRKFRIKINNDNQEIASNCFAKMTSFINNDGSESRYTGEHFRLSGDVADANGVYHRSLKFNIAGESHEIVEIADVTEVTSLPTTNMLFATKTVAMPKPKFPHVLKIQFGGDNVRAVTKTYRMFFTGGMLRMNAE